jgi:hypothetical protein
MKLHQNKEQVGMDTPGPLLIFFKLPIMNELTITTPALFFPGISLIMLAYTNRFLTLASVVRALHAEYLKQGKKEALHSQIQNLRYRLKLVKNMQALGVVSFLSCIACMYCVIINAKTMAHLTFGFGVFAFMASLFLSLMEIRLSTRALEVELGDMDNLTIPTWVEYIKSKFAKK